MIINIVKVFLPALGAFIVGILFTPFLTNFLYSHKMWKKKSGKIALDGCEAKIFNELHKEKEINTPRMGGIIIWFSSAVVIIGIWLMAKIFPGDIIIKLDFLSRSQTWLPLATLILGALVGLVDDYLEIRPNITPEEIVPHGGSGLSLKKRLLIVSVIATGCAWWFYAKLGVDSIGLPFNLGNGELYLGPFFIILFLLTTLFIYAGGVIDGLDGLAGGVFTTMFAAYGGIAFYQQQINLAAFCTTVVGGLLAFLWFNLPPARFYMSETGTMGLTITLTVVAFMTDRLGEGYGFLVLPIIALPLVVTVLSNILQVLSKKFRGKKIFLVAPLHHHFEAMGWPSYKVTMRYWIISIVCAILGITLALIG
jgi:phospho-N-acetylmuramoyl-pentapeptide-transferase